MKSRYFLGILMIALMGVFGLSACGGSTGPSGSGEALNSGAASVNFSVRLAGAPGAPKALAIKASEGEDGHDGPESADDAGTVIALTEVRANIREVKFYLPEGVTCEEVQFTFIDPVRCDNDDNGHDDWSDDGKAVEGPSDDGEVSDEAEDESADDSDLGEVEDDSDDDGDDEDKVVVEGPFVVDLIAGTSTPSLTNMLIPAGLYTRIEVKLHETEDDNTLPAGDPLNGHSLVASGQFEYQGAMHTLNLRIKFSEEIRFENAAGIDVGEAGANDVVVSLDETSWFKGIKLAACLDEGHLAFSEDGSLNIDDNSGEGECGDIENIIKDNIESSGNVSDEDDDGEDADEAEDEGEQPDGNDDDGTPDQGPGDL